LQARASAQEDHARAASEALKNAGEARDTAAQKLANTPVPDALARLPRAVQMLLLAAFIAADYPLTRMSLAAVPLSDRAITAVASCCRRFPSGAVTCAACSERMPSSMLTASVSV
jgi:hypothetical protein